MNIPVSIILPVFNERREHLLQCIKSLKEQSYQSIEIVVVDDGSTDPATCEVLQELQEDNRFKIFRTENRGLSAALNFGISKCSSAIIARQDSDDWSSPERIATQLQVLIENPDVDLIGSDVYFHQADGKLLWKSSFPKKYEDIVQSFPNGCPILHPSIMFRKNTLLQVGGYREDLKNAEDYDLFWRISEVAKIENIDRALYHVRWHQYSKSSHAAAEQDFESQVVRELANLRKEKKPQDLEIAKKNAQIVLGEVPEWQRLTRRADFLTLAGQYSSALNLYTLALRQNPFSVQALVRVLRLAVFQLIPPLRPILFNPKLKAKLRGLIKSP